MKKLFIILAVISAMVFTTVNANAAGAGVIEEEDKIEIELKQSALFNLEDGENDYVIAKTIYKLDKFDIDIWAKDIDRLIGLEEEYTAGLAVAYRLGKLSDYISWIKDIPVINIINEYCAFSIGYGIGVENTFTHGCEFKQGIYTGGFEIKVGF